MLGHIISSVGLAIDPKRIKAIKALPMSSNKKIIQSFLDEVNFVRNFINDFSKVVSPITTMLNKYAQFSWFAKAKKAFHDIKKPIIEALVLKNPNFSKDFIMYEYGV